MKLKIHKAYMNFNLYSEKSKQEKKGKMIKQKVIMQC